MKITLVTAYYYPEISSVTHLYRDLAEDLAQAGHSVTVVTNVPVRGLEEGVRREYLSRLEETTPQGVHIRRVGSRAVERPGLMARGLRFIGNTLALYRAAARIPTDAYLVGSMPPYLGLAGAWLNRKAPSAFILQDIFPDSLIAMERLSPEGALCRLFRWIEKKSYAGNSRVITISGDMEKTLLAKGVPAQKIRVVPNWADPGEIVPVAREDNSLFDELNLSRLGFYAVYAGTLGILQDPDVILDAAKLTPKKITYLILGAGTLEAHLKERLEREYIENVRILPMQPVERISQVYSLGDVALIPLKQGVTDIAFPSKTFSAMAAARPVLAAAQEGSAWAELIGSFGGAVFTPQSARSLCDGVQRLYQLGEEREALGLRAREYLLKHCARRASTGRYEQILREMTGKEDSHAL